MPAAFVVITVGAQTEAEAAGNWLFPGRMAESRGPATITESI